MLRLALAFFSIMCFAISSYSIVNTFGWWSFTALTLAGIALSCFRFEQRRREEREIYSRMQDITNHMSEVLNARNRPDIRARDGGL